jgi:hypothetical protein
VAANEAEPRIAGHGYNAERGGIEPCAGAMGPAAPRILGKMEMGTTAELISYAVMQGLDK